MRIALYGYGKMGKAIEAIAVARGHEVVLKVGSANQGTPPTGADVAIEFSTPDQALSNMRLCMEHGVPVVVGTTGWYERLNEVRAMVDRNKGTLLWASNFSIGVNLFFRLNKMLAGLMDQQPQYAVRMEDIHHIQKLDAPSGTAITLARDIDLKTKRYSGWKLLEGDRQEQEQGQSAIAPTALFAPSPVAINSERTGEVPGTHTITWTGPDDRISMTHEAFGRTGFATGAVVAAEWIQGRRGLFTMEDVLGA